MNKKDYQQHLPDGLCLGDELTTSRRDFGCVFEATDTRLHRDYPVTRVVRFLDGVVDKEETPVAAKGEFQDRLRQLLSCKLPHVSTPCEAGQLPNGTFYLVGEHNGISLLSKIQFDKGISLGDGEGCLKAMLTGLAALHARELPHGDLRPGNIFLQGDGTRRIVWIADAAIGPMTWWTDARSLHAATIAHLPPEWKNKTEKPNKQSDMYALGLTACEMFLGKNALIGLNSDDSSAWPQFKRKLREAGVSRPTRHLLRVLLDPDPQKRPTDAGKALERWQELQRTRYRPFLVAMTVMAAVVLGLLLWHVRSGRDQMATLTEQLASLRQQSDKAIRERDGKINDLESEITNWETKYSTAITLIDEAKEAFPDWFKHRRPTLPTDEIAKAIWTSKLHKDNDIEYAKELDGLWNAFDPTQLKKDPSLGKNELLLNKVCELGRSWRITANAHFGQSRLARQRELW